MINYKNNRIESIDLLRGVAALAVVLYHFTHAKGVLDTEGIIYNMFKYGGGFGVSMFFLISGYILPFSMYKGKYVLNNYKSFFFKRIIRIEPVFIASIFFTIFVFYTCSQLPPAYWNYGDYKVDFTNFVLHLGYLISFFKAQEWINPVFWSLGIEFQFYLILGLIYPLLVTSKKYLNGICLIGFSLFFWFLFLWLIEGTYLHYGGTVLRVLPMFFIGTAVFQLKEGLISKYAFTVVILILAYLCYFEFKIGDNLGVLIAVLVVFFIKKSPRIFLFLGKISFSLYLIHIPIGGFIKLFVVAHISDDFLRTILILLGIIPTILISYGFYKVIEEPCVLWSKKIKYHESKNN